MNIFLATDETRMKHGLKNKKNHPCSIHVSSVAKKTTLDRPALLRLTRKLIALADIPIASLTLIFTDDDTSAHFNQLLLCHEGPTDIITQFYEPFPGEPPGLTAELYINLHRAAHVGNTRHGVSPNRELLLYIAHGLNHLAGHDDATPLLRRAMRRRENAWLNLLAIPETPLFQLNEKTV